MLGKLIKYDLRVLFKYELGFALASLALAVIVKLLWMVDGSTVATAMAEMLQNFAMTTAIAMVVNTMMRAWAVMFARRMYGDESYLSHTLPVTRAQNYNSKFLSAMIAILFGVVAGGVAIFLAYNMNLETINAALSELASALDASTVGLVLAVVILVFVELVNMLSVVFSATIMTHKFERNRAVKGFLTGLAGFLVTQGVVVMVIFLLGLHNPNVMSLFGNGMVDSTETLKQIFWSAIAAYGTCAVVYYWFNLKMLQAGVDVD